MDGNDEGARFIGESKRLERVTRRIEKPAFRSPNDRSPTRLAEGTEYSSVYRAFAASSREEDLSETENGQGQAENGV